MRPDRLQTSTLADRLARHLKSNSSSPTKRRLQRDILVLRSRPEIKYFGIHVSLKYGYLEFRNLSLHIYSLGIDMYELQIEDTEMTEF